MTALLEATGISKRFGGLLAIDNVSLVLPRAAIHSIIGPNGAGKTTLFNCLTSFVKPSAGEIRLNGERIDGLRPDLVAAQGIARTYQNIRLFPDLTTLENIMVGVDAKRPESLLGALFSTPKHRETVRATTARANELLQALGLAGRGDRLARHLPYGDQRRYEPGGEPCDDGTDPLPARRARADGAADRASDAGCDGYLRTHHGT
jgi:branched-chain amino acid transport system ATP-binding protein